MPGKRKKRKARIRPLALGIFRQADLLFLARGYDASINQTFYRPIGGKIEFGERGSDALIREVQEEIGQQICEPVYLGALENIFTYEDRPGHEIALIYAARFSDPAMYRPDLVMTGRDDGDMLYEATWLPLESFHGEGAPPLYPAGLLDMLDPNG